MGFTDWKHLHFRSPLFFFWDLCHRVTTFCFLHVDVARMKKKIAICEHITGNRPIMSVSARGAGFVFHPVIGCRPKILSILEFRLVPAGSGQVRCRSFRPPIIMIALFTGLGSVYRYTIKSVVLYYIIMYTVFFFIAPLIILLLFCALCATFVILYNTRARLQKRPTRSLLFNKCARRPPDRASKVREKR